MSLIKLIIVAALIAIILALGSGLVFMLRDQADSQRTVKSLTLRIGLSLALIAFLVLAYLFGLIEPHGIQP